MTDDEKPDLAILASMTEYVVTCRSVVFHQLQIRWDVRVPKASGQDLPAVLPFLGADPIPKARPDGRSEGVICRLSGTTPSGLTSKVEGARLSCFLGIPRLIPKASAQHGRRRTTWTNNARVSDQKIRVGQRRTSLLRLRNQQVVGSSPTAGSRNTNKSEDSDDVEVHRRMVDPIVCNAEQSFETMTVHRGQ